ncbi:tetratricopeptide repeat protein [Flavobacterium daejeonense]|uniref:tetratricopeptide repeat protein n=1 Tax=Flavobacterium daejeonense TaxID=350893 RepID=UPI00047B03EC|nr:tetratricopeptide repeat protein [Flavobacterium daejeonense]
MNVTDYTYLINHPNTITNRQTLALENVLEEFPYFQSARALRLKGLYNENSFKYNSALKVTAAHTTDRAVLFDFISSDDFNAIQKELFEKKKSELLSIKVIDSIEVIAKKEIEETISNFESLNNKVEEETIPQTTEEKLELGKPLEFSKNETHSFQEWLQLSRIQPIVRESEIKEDTISSSPEEDSKKKKEAIIDKFIQNNPKIPSIKPGTSSNFSIDINKDDTTSLMTETLAKVYLEQKKYQKAIQAYEILILKYPEKSSFFADRIADIKILQQNNN